MANELNDLVARVAAIDSDLGLELRRQVATLTGLRPNGLNFERHVPEQVALHGRPISVGDKVRFIPKRGSTHVESEQTWIVTKLIGSRGNRVAELLHRRSGETATREVEDVVFVADFRDPIYPGLASTGRVERGGDKPFHTVINAENYHALEALTYTHVGKVDVMYLDPPYNTRASDWKYNNDYVDPSDAYAHSKWLSFMERRLKVAERLLNPADSVLIVTIDEKERNRLGLLLEQTFPSSDIQTISSVINPKGASLGRDFARVDEQIYVVYIGSAGVKAQVRDMLDEGKNAGASTSVKWSSLIRGGAQGIRTDSPGAYYPVFIDVAQNRIHSFGAALPWDQSRDDVAVPGGTVAVWPPLHTSGVEGRWGIGPEAAAALYEKGALRLGKIDLAQDKFPLSYLSSGIMKKVESGEILTLGRTADGTLIVRYPENTKVTQPKTIWNMQSHNAGEYGSKLVATILPGRRFPFPKSLYAVEDTLSFFIADKPEALVVDFFAGSGTTAHAVMRLNRQDGGCRRSISVTNNEVSASEQSALIAANRRPGDPEWEALGICDYITKPRVTAAVTGKTPSGDPIKGDYKFTDEFPMADGFEENVEFFTLTYLNPEIVELDLAFSSVSPLLWMRAGSRGRRIDERSDTYDIADAYAVLFDVDAAAPFLKDIDATDDLVVVYIVTDDEPQFQAIAMQLPEGIEAVRLYESYLRTFAINTEGA